MPRADDLEKGFRIGDWEVYPARNELRCGDDIEQPEPRIMKALLALAECDGEILSRDELVRKVWDGRYVTDDPINQCMTRLRATLRDRDRPYRYVEAVTKRGYRLKQPVVLLQAQDFQVDRHPSRRSRAWLPAAFVAAVVAIVLLARFAWPPAATAPVGSIAVLPCENLTGSAENQYLVSGFEDEFVQTLHRIPNFTVKQGRLRYDGVEARQIAETLGVESLLACWVQRDGESLKVGYSIVRGIDGVSFASGNVSGQAENLFELQQSLARTLRVDVLGESGPELVSSSRPANFEAYDRYMRARLLFSRRGEPGQLDLAIRLFGETIELDPRFGPAYLSLAMAYALLPDAQNAPLGPTHARALEIVDDGIRADPSITEAAQAIRGFVFHKRKDWLLAEQAYRRAIAADFSDPVGFNALNWYSLMLAGVGRLDDALAVALEAVRRDPSNGVFNSRVAIAYTWLGENDRALEYFSRARELGGTSSTYFVSYALVMQRLGRLDEALDYLQQGVGGDTPGAQWAGAAHAALRGVADSGQAIDALDRAADDGTINPQFELTLRMVLGDVDGAAAVAQRLAHPGTTYELDLLFLPELEPLRRRPEFVEFMERLGITEYWDTVGCTWSETRVECPGDI